MFFIISSEYLNYYYLCPRTDKVITHGERYESLEGGVGGNETHQQMASRTIGKRSSYGFQMVY